MIRNYIKIAFRNIFKNKIYSVLNIVGLSIGIACTLLLFLFVQDELSYDTDHPFAKRTYRVAGKFNMMGQKYDLAVTPAPLGKTFLTDFPEVESFVRFRDQGSQIVNYKNNSFKERNAIFADNSVFEIFNVHLIYGNKENALKEPNTIVLSKNTAKKYFGNSNPIGETLKIDNKYDYKVTGVYDEIAPNTHFKFDIIMSMESLEESRELIWLSNNFNTYIVLSENADPKKLEEQFPEFIKKYFSTQIEQVLGTPFDEIDKDQLSASFYLQPLTSIHLHSDLLSELGPNSDIQYVYIFSIIAGFILLIAAINFINISTARSAKRAKEVGIRKVLGSQKNELVGQFLTESILTTLISLVIAIVLIVLFLPPFNDLTGKQLVLDFSKYVLLLPVILAIVFFVGILAGSYPAFVLSSYGPVLVLSGKIKNASKSGNFRSGLVVFQFAIAIVLIISTIVVYNQLNYIQNKKLGFDKNQIVILNNAFLLDQNTSAMKDAMLNYPEVENATISSFLPVPSAYNNSAVYPNGKQNEMVSVQQWTVDYDYIETMKINIIKGRNFSKQFGSDDQSVIINEATVKQFGLSEPLGSKLVRFTNKENETLTMTVIGVVEDFHFESLRKNISPLIMYLGESDGAISFRVNTADMSGFISKLESKWNELAPGQPFNYSFLDERFNNMYFAEKKVGDIFTIFAALAIFTGCLGLFGLSAFSAEEKTKEIGIRKVLGSTISQIVLMLSKEFIKLIGISFIIAAPIGYYLMNNWLQNFEYRTELNFGIIFLSGVIVILIAIFTVSYHAVKAASKNPITSIKYE